MGQVDAALKAHQLSDDPGMALHAELCQHRDAVNPASQQQLYLLNIALETSRAILARLSCLDKALGKSNVDKTGALFDELQVSVEVSFFSFYSFLTKLSPLAP